MSEGRVGKPEQDPSFWEQPNAQQLIEQRISAYFIQLQCNLNISAVLCKAPRLPGTGWGRCLNFSIQCECLKTVWWLMDHFCCEFKAIVMSETVSSMSITEFKLKATAKRHEPKYLCLRQKNWYINWRITWNTLYLRKCIYSKTH